MGFERHRGQPSRENAVPWQEVGARNAIPAHRGPLPSIVKASV